jgi:hypothetical protein
MKLTKLSRNVGMCYHFVPAPYPYDCVVNLTLSAEFMDSADFVTVSLSLKISSFGGTFCIHHVDS